MVANAPTVARNSPLWRSLAFPEGEDIVELQCDESCSLFAGCSGIQGLIAGMLFGSVCSLSSMAGVIGTLLVARSSAYIGGSSDESDISSDGSVSVSPSESESESESEQSSLGTVATESVSSSWDTVGIRSLC